MRLFGRHFLLFFALLCALSGMHKEPSNVGILVPSASAGINHGQNTTFDCNAWGGSCACFMSAASGKCGNATAHYSNATCNGGDDSTALADWITYGHSLGTSLAVLFIPPGCTEGDFGGDNNYSFSGDVKINCAGFGTQPITTIQNAVIWGYGTTFTSLWFGGIGFFTAQNTQGVEFGCSSGPTNTSPLIQAANAGDNTITLVTPSDATGNLSVGDEIVVTALGNESTGTFPPSHTFHEHKHITSINAVTGVLGINDKLKYSYKTTYPNLGGTQPFEGGPAAIYLMEKTYATNSQYFGMTVTCGSCQTNIVGKSIILTDVTWSDPTSNPAPTQSESIQLIRTSYPNLEVDKEVDSLSIISSLIGNITVQSSSVNNLAIQGTTFGGQGTSGFLNGTPLNTSILNTKIPSGIRAGPTCCGQAVSLSLNNVTVPTASANFHHTAISAYSFSAGVLTIAKSSTEYTNGTSPGMWVPTHKYFMGDTDGSNSCSSPNTFTVNDLQDAGANVNIFTDIVSIPTGNICVGVRPPSTFGSYNVMSLTQTNSGPANLLSLPEMLPP